LIAVPHEQFKAAYESFRPSAILLDLMMPHVDGVALLENLAASGALCASHSALPS
jgi:CheY-like chemotaxis protein